MAMKFALRTKASSAEDWSEVQRVASRQVTRYEGASRARPDSTTSAQLATTYLDGLRSLGMTAPEAYELVFGGRVLRAGKEVPTLQKWLDAELLSGGGAALLAAAKPPPPPLRMEPILPNPTPPARSAEEDEADRFEAMIRNAADYAARGRFGPRPQSKARRD